MRDNKREPAVVVPLVVWPVVVGVQPTTIVVAVRVEQVRIAVGNTQETISVTAPRILLGLYRIRHRNALVSRAKYLRFLTVTCITLSEAMTADNLDARILGSVAGSRNRPHIHLLPFKF